MNLRRFRRLIFRSWYYFRIGYGTYVAFPLGFVSTMIVIYELALKDISQVHDYFPHLYVFGIVALLVIGPVSIYAGLYHLKRTGAYSAEASVLTESNPYVYKAIPGKEREVFLPLMMLTAKGLAKVMEQQHSMTLEEQREFQTVLGKAKTLLEGASVGLPKDKPKSQELDLFTVDRLQVQKQTTVLSEQTFSSNKGIISSPDWTSDWKQMSEDLPQTKYVVEVTVPEKSPMTPKQYVQDLKGVVGGKQLARMKKEAVDCPVLARTVSFAQCFACPNFIRRVKGKVDCRGFPLPTSA